MANKRKANSNLQKILELDVGLTKQFTQCANKYLPLRALKFHYKMLEVSCHGIPWFAFWIAFTWLFNNPNLVELQVNMLFGLTIDIILIAVLKSYTRRRRPVANNDDKLGQIGPDKFSFPSGHASRACLVAFFFIHLFPVSVLYYPPLLAWATSVCISRVLLNRHYLFDVFGGVLLGLSEGLLLAFLWVPDDTAKWIMNNISDDTWSGGEYHV